MSIYLSLGVIILLLFVIISYLYYKNKKLSWELKYSKDNLSDMKQKEIKLEHLNHQLEEKITKALQLNIEKDRSIIDKSRLAQLGEMISVIAHQWRQPLTAISATCNNLILKSMSSKDLDKNEIQHELHLVTDYIKNLSKTLDDFRNFFKKNRYKENTTVDKIIDETLYILSSSIKNNNIDLVTKLDADIEIETFVGEMKQVILNLIKNAQDTLKMNNINQPQITINTYQDKDFVVIEISDNAKGIPLNSIDKIFEPYFSTKKELDGTGLGLYISKIIVEKNCNGKLLVTNKSDGAIFIVKLPINNH
jgi:C4-dicarboxylate-specific signal transduction histidine kinase